MRRRSAQGFSFVELMVALAIGLVLLGAFVTVLARCRDQFATDESVARLADASRHALSVLVPDLEHAGFFGFATAHSVQYQRGGAVLASGAALAQAPMGAEVPVLGVPPGAHACGGNFALDLRTPVQGSDDAWPAAVACAPTAAAQGARAGSDTLTVRHAALGTAAPRSGRLQLYSRRRDVAAPLTIFGDGRAPGPIDAEHEVRDLEVRTYYVANSSVDRPGWPALRVKALTEASGSPQFRDEEVLPGVEDLQVELGIAVHGHDGTRLRFVPAHLPEPGARVVAVRLWLRIRADSTEGGYRDARPLQYSNATFTPTADESRHRRVLLERTVALRNVEDWGADPGADP